MTKNPQHRNTVADNIKGDVIPAHWVGYYHTLTVIDREQLIRNPKNFNV